MDSAPPAAAPLPIIYGSCLSRGVWMQRVRMSNAESIIGGAVFLYETPVVTISASGFWNNSAELAGGCLAMFTRARACGASRCRM